MQRALVTGGAGFIGSHLCERLVAEGSTVVSLDDYSLGNEANHVKGVEYVRGSTADISTLITDTPTVLFHLGEYPRVEQSFVDIETVLTSNVVGTKAVFEFARQHMCKVVYAGSSTKFADGGFGRDQSPYAWTKAANTELLRNYHAWFGVPYAITYFYNVYGPRERSQQSNGTVVAIFAERWRTKQPLIVTAPGTQQRNFTHVLDIVEGLWLVGVKGQGDEYGLGHPDSYTIREVAELFGGEMVLGPERPGNRMQSTVHLDRAQLELGWQPQHNLPDYITALKQST
ncbi:NAD-dependent epimerase/dehydratase family protein [Candidatus Kaiserbacteria bacterium]|nr:NAD-dependent epimerase/dehydratase family protein [Candidatus Kaiserbacteria bacterium]